MKIIFLDIDGVLNHWSGKKSHNEHIKYNVKDGRFFDFNYINIRRTEKFLLKAIKNKYKIVISSSWRNMKEWILAIKFILGKNVEPHIIGSTGRYLNSSKIYNGREREIIEYLENNKSISSSIVLDDEVNSKRMRGISEVIKSKSRKGFRKKHYKLGLKLLRRNRW